MNFLHNFARFIRNCQILLNNFKMWRRFRIFCFSRCTSRGFFFAYAPRQSDTPPLPPLAVHKCRSIHEEVAAVSPEGIGVGVLRDEVPESGPSRQNRSRRVGGIKMYQNESCMHTFTVNNSPTFNVFFTKRSANRKNMLTCFWNFHEILREIHQNRCENSTNFIVI